MDIYKNHRAPQYPRQPHDFQVITSERPITEDEAKEIQREFGYDVRGYGFDNFKVRSSDGKFIASWTCSYTCD